MHTEELDSLREAVLHTFNRENMAAENALPIPEEASLLLGEHEKALTCPVCDARCPTYFHYCFNCGTSFEP
ncbi:hypothetical protein KDI_36070 [Dictyobacter arantiisoli]|uniref:Uncharacterized protein n=1 Tax=Dictyobacter arantiisoli TaxID=2014874 RepID=A0A5A5TG46_9CHLR|nr:hypothetical protein KDI_36070 [Dictyobacter arantiisoli]